MGPGRLAVAAAALACSLGALSACKSSGQSEGQVRIEALIVDIERLQAEFQRCRADLVRSLVAHDAMISLQEGDLLAHYRSFNASLTEGEERVVRVDRRIADVRASGEAYFAVWEESLEAISKSSLRGQSKKRMARTRGQLEDVLEAAARTREAIDPLVQGMRDHATFLGNDLNAESIALLQDDLGSLQESATRVYEHVDEFVEAGRAFTRNVTMQIPAAPTEAAAR